VTNHVHTPTAILAFGSHRQRHAQKNKKLQHDITATVKLQRKDVLCGLESFLNNQTALAVARVNTSATPHWNCYRQPWA